MKTRDKFRILKRSLEAAWSNLSFGKSSTAKFPDSDFVLCNLLVALRVLHSRGHIYKLGLSQDATPFAQAEKLFGLVNSLCQPSVRISTTLTPNDSIERALSELDKNAIEVLQNDLTISYSYQFLSMSARKLAQAKVQTANKEHSVDDLIAFTQLYTPDWVVDFLMANSIRSAAAATGPGAEYKKWIVNTTHSTESVSLERRKILDPACGAGNFLVRAMDFVIQRQLRNGLDSTTATRLAIESNIFGVDIDSAAAWISCLALLVKSMDYSDSLPDARFNIYLAEETNKVPLLGSIDRSFSEQHILSQKYDVVLMNPPYIGRKLMSRELKIALKESYPNSHSDICTAFMERSLELLKPGGTLGVITQASMLTLPSYGQLRKRILTQHNLRICVDAGTNVFPLQGGDKVNSVILVIENSTALEAERSLFFDLRRSEHKADHLLDLIEANNNLADGSYYKHSQSIFLEERESAIKYACPQIVLQIVRQAQKLQDIADVRQGLATTNNDRFIRLADDVPEEEIGTKWFPYVKGAGADRWFSQVKHVVNWHNNGEEIKAAVNDAYPYLNGNIKWVVKNEQFYFREGLCFSFVNTGRLAVRRLPAGCIFDVGASALFAHDKSDELFLLAYLNSSLIGAIASAINPTINFQVGDIKCLPMFPFQDSQKRMLALLATQCCSLKEALQAASRISNDSNNEQQASERLSAIEFQKLCEMECEIDRIVFDALVANFKLTVEQQAEISNWVNRQHRALSYALQPVND